MTNNDLHPTELSNDDLDRISGAYLKYKLQDAIISSVHASASPPAAAVPTPIKRP